MKKNLLIILTILPMMAMADDSGTCGDNLTWTYTEKTQTLTIQGTGDMNDYGNKYVAPWKKYRSNIKSIFIKEGVTSIGNNAFFSCNSMEELSIENTVTSIRDYAFAYCSALTSISIPDNVTSLGSYCFQNCI